MSVQPPLSMLMKWPLKVSGDATAARYGGVQPSAKFIRPSNSPDARCPAMLTLPLGGSDSPPQPNEAPVETWKFPEPAIESPHCRSVIVTLNPALLPRQLPLSRSDALF